MKPIAIINNDNESLRIVYNLTDVCNYKCNYCWPESHSGTTRWPDYEKACRSFDHIISVYKNDLNKKHVRFHFLGGEPTLWPKLGDFAKYIYDQHGCRITMSTNGSRTVRWWEQYAEYFDDIQLSVHHEECDVEHLKIVADTIYSKQTVMVSLAVMMDPLAWDKSFNILNELVAHPTPILVKAIILRRVDNSVIREEYSNEQIEFLRNKIKKLPTTEYIKKMKVLNNIDQDTTNAHTHFDDGTVEKYNTFEIVKNHWNSFVGWNCHILQDVIAVNPAGEVAGGCGEKKFTGDKFFNIFDDDFTKEFSADAIGPISCRMPFCGCSTNARITKYKNGHKNV